MNDDNLCTKSSEKESTVQHVHQIVLPGCGGFGCLLAAIGLAILVWALKGFPHFW